MKYFRSEFEAGVKAPMTITSCSRVSSPTCWASAGKRSDASGNSRFHKTGFREVVWQPFM
jgi:hypothetical protein